jgi:HD-GYP domain-containing protein (c-di-GMP phosphodiesterase class II)
VLTSKLSHGRSIWTLATVAFAFLIAITFFGPLADQRWESPELLFSLVLVVVGVCVLGTTIVIAIADRRELAEVGLLGTALMGAAVMPLVHGLATPGILFGETEAFRTAIFLSLPMSVLVGAPLLTPHSAFGRWASRHWRDWSLIALVGVFTMASVVISLPDAIVSPGPTDPATIATAVGLVVLLGALSARQLRLYEIGHQRSNMITGLSLLALATSALLPLTETAYSPAFWWLHVAAAVGVIGACIGLSATIRMSKTALELLDPVLARDPLVAFELGLSPVVHNFVASLEDKDLITRDHVIRTAELAVRVGERFGLSARDLRNLGLAALLHDVGKLNVPDEILKNPGRLKEEEFEVIKLHTVHGEQMLLDDPTLASAAHIVRSHHERIDGRGYPDGLIGREIPLPSRIIAVCDALDAMTNDSHYRDGMSTKMAFAVLREHAGAQWDESVIEQVMAVLPTMPLLDRLQAVGRIDPASDSTEADSSIPDDIGELLALVDVEI